MTRTPLLSALRSLAREGRRARRAKLPLDAWREARGVEPTRRAVLAGAAAGLAGMALACSGLPRRQRARIAIVGGGLAGLNAALELRDAGLACTLFESSSRLGGRVFSNSAHWEGGQVSEGGGEFIDSSHERMRALAERFELTLLDARLAAPAGALETVHLGGRFVSRAEIERQFLRLLPALDADSAAVLDLSFASSTAESRRLDSQSVHAWIASRVEGGHASELGALLDVAYASEFGADTLDQSAVNLLWMLGEQPEPGGFETFGTSDERFRVAGGNQRVGEAIVRTLRSAAAIHTGQRLEALWPAADGSVRLALAAGGATRDWSFDFVILALPFATLRRLDLARAGFDPLQQRIVDELGRGRNGKLQLQHAQRVSARSGPWPGVASGASFHDGDYQVSWDSACGQPGSQALICLYTGGSLAERTDTTAAFGSQSMPSAALDARRGLRAFDAVFPGSEGGWNGRATLSLPFRSESLGLSYSYYRVGQVQAFSGREAAPQGPDGTLLLAGEHTSVEFQGFMEGAAVSGREAARRVVERVRA